MKTTEICVKRYTRFVFSVFQKTKTNLNENMESFRSFLGDF